MDQGLTIVSTIIAIREEIREVRAQNKKIAFVPTMGALHKGHLSLIDLARKHADFVVCSIFVNPKQFGEGEDLDAYPRPLVDDIRALEKQGADLVFTPTVEEMYPAGFSTTVSVSGITQGLCGSSRPDHFDGVATIVSKLLLQVRPDIAIFGEKDFQQLQVIKRLVKDLDIDGEILGAPIVREEDGLALSSRNQYLSSSERLIAPTLYQVLQKIADQLNNGELIKQVLDDGKMHLENTGFKVDYLELRDAQTLRACPKTLETINDGDTTYRLLTAVYLGNTRLIDNIDLNSR